MLMVSATLSRANVYTLCFSSSVSCMSEVLATYSVGGLYTNILRAVIAARLVVPRRDKMVLDYDSQRV